jgi:transposase-like protein
MVTYTIKFSKGERVIYEGSRRLSPEEVEAYDKSLEERNKYLNMVCPGCGQVGETTAKKNGEPRKKKCPDCGDTMVRSFNILIKKDSSQIKRKVRKFNHEGMDKDMAHKFYESSIEGSKKRIEGVGGASHYKAVVPDMDYMVKTGQATKMDDSDVQQAQKARKEMVVKHTQNGKKFSSKRSNNSQSSK